MDSNPSCAQPQARMGSNPTPRSDYNPNPTWTLEPQAMPHSDSSPSLPLF